MQVPTLRVSSVHRHRKWNLLQRIACFHPISWILYLALAVILVRSIVLYLKLERAMNWCQGLDQEIAYSEDHCRKCPSWCDREISLLTERPPAWLDVLLKRRSLDSSSRIGAFKMRSRCFRPCLCIVKQSMDVDQALSSNAGKISTASCTREFEDLCFIVTSYWLLILQAHR